MTDPFRLNRIIRDVMADDIRRLDNRFGIGIIDAVEGGFASVHKGDPQAPATPGFVVPPDMSLAPGDQVLYMDAQRMKLVLRALNRNVVLPDDLTLVNLTLTGRLIRDSVVDPPALSADTHNWAPDGLGDAYVVRITQTGGPWSLTGILAGRPGIEHLLLNVSAATINIQHDDAGSVDANRFYAPVDPFPIRVNGGVRVWYDDASARWRVASP